MTDKQCYAVGCGGSLSKLEHDRFAEVLSKYTDDVFLKEELDLLALMAKLDTAWVTASSTDPALRRLIDRGLAFERPCDAGGFNWGITEDGLALLKAHCVT